MSHPDDMSPQEDLAVGCFILFVFAVILIAAVAAGALFGYYIYHLINQGVLS